MIVSRRLVSACGLIIILCFFFFGFRPFEFSPINRVSWTPPGGGLYFEGIKGMRLRSVGGLAYSAPFKVSSTRMPGVEGTITVSIGLRPADEPVSGVPHFLALADSRGREILYLGQWKHSLIVRWFKIEANGRRTLKELGLSRVLSPEKILRLAVVSDRAGTTVYVDGKKAGYFARATLLDPKDSLRGTYIVLGNSPAAKNAWAGTILDLSLYEKALTSLAVMEEELRLGENPPASADVPRGLIARFDLRGGGATFVPDASGNGNTLLVPERIHVKGRFLDPAMSYGPITWSTVNDVSVNILGFILFGFVFAWWFSDGGARNKMRAYLIVGLLGSLISLSIETIQTFIPARDSSLRDLICNIAGTIMGILIFHLLRGRIRVKQRGLM